MDHPTVIAGAGIAGVSAGLALMDRCPLLVAGLETPEAASSSVVAGLANPLIPRRGNLVWRGEEALDALDAVADQLGVSPLQPGVLRIATSWDQMDAYRARAASHSHLCTWHASAQSERTWPWLRAPYGTLEIHRGGSFDLPGLLRAGVARMKSRGVSVRRDWQLVGWGETGDAVEAQFLGPDGPRTFVCGRLILSLGAGYTAFPRLRALRLDRVKGQLMSVSPAGNIPNFRPVSVGGYAVPMGDKVVVGSSYVHDFENADPEEAVNRELLRKVAPSLPWLEGATVHSTASGIRVTVPGTRLPMVGPLPGHERTWILTGLASRGLLMGPLIASRLAEWLEAPAAIPSEVAVRLG